MAQLVTINVAQLVTIKMAKRGPVSNFTAYTYALRFDIYSIEDVENAGLKTAFAYIFSSPLFRIPR